MKTNTNNHSEPHSERLITIDVSDWNRRVDSLSLTILMIAAVVVFLCLTIVAFIIADYVQVPEEFKGHYFVFNVGCLLMLSYLIPVKLSNVISDLRESSSRDSRLKAIDKQNKFSSAYWSNYLASAEPLAKSYADIQEILNKNLTRKRKFYLDLRNYKTILKRLFMSSLFVMLSILLIYDSIIEDRYFFGIVPLEFLSMIDPFYDWRSPDISRKLIFIIYFSYVLIPGIIVVAYLKGLRQLIDKDANAVLEEEESPVLLLRSFKDDSLKANMVGRNPIKAMLVKYMDHANKDKTSNEYQSYIYRREVEVLLRDEAEKIAPLVAIGQPGEHYPLPGAYRAYFEDSEWQQAILKWMNKSKLIIVICGTTDMVGWELNNILSKNLLDKTIIFFPTQTESFNFVEKTIKKVVNESPSTKARWNKLTTIFKDTDWYQPLLEAESQDTIALRLLPDGRVLRVVSSKTLERGREGENYRDGIDYVMAFKVCVYQSLMDKTKVS